MVVQSRIVQGDVIKVNFNPQKGHEQAGYRPAIVISNRLSQGWLSVAILCPVTHTNRNNPFHHKLIGYDFVNGYVLCDQVKSMDLEARTFQIIGHLRDDDTYQIIEKVKMLIEKE